MNLNDIPAPQLLQQRRRLRRELQAGASTPVRIAVLGGVTTNEVVDLLELQLLSEGFQPVFYQSEYGRYYEDAVLDADRIREFKPDLVFVCVHYLNIQQFPPVGATEEEFRSAVDAEAGRFQSIWRALHEQVGCQIVQNNFELPPCPILGNLDAVQYGGQTRFVNALNQRFADYAQQDRRLLLHDLNALSARLGHDQWFDWNRWFAYKILTTPEGSHAIARSLGAMILALRGKAKKCLVLDLDNTLWGGVIGDDGVDKLQIGRETPVAEAYTAFQEYCLALRQRGVLLAVCSKNNLDVAQSGFAHPDMVLKMNHFAAFRANWEPKHENIKSIAEELNLGVDSFVFVDDNPAERALVAAQLPMVFVPEVGSDVSLYPQILQRSHCFEAVTFSAEDLLRAEGYAANAVRTAAQAQFANYGEYLDSLEMTAEIAPFEPMFLDRITQLTNKSNQFNLTTRRYTHAEIEDISRSELHIGLYGRLADKFGDNGLISVIIGRREERKLHLDLWLMSCRVLKRDMEIAMLDTLVEHARTAGVEEIYGYFRRTPKNSMVQEHYATLGFELVSRLDDGSESVWRLPVGSYERRSRHIQVTAVAHA